MSPGKFAGLATTTECDVRVFWPAGLALVLATAAVLLLPESRGRRLANLDLTGSGIGDTFLMLSRSHADRCRLADRRESTLRRSDPRQPGQSWECLRLSARDGGGQAHPWLVRSKRRGRGTALFVPVRDVRDWTYPFLYGFVREHREELELPAVAWTQLFVNRLYQGLYLRVNLPFDLRRKDGGSGVLRELLTVRDGRLTAVDTRFNAAGSLYAAVLEAGSFPEPVPPPAELAWLAQRCPTPGTTFLMSNVAPHALSLLPLPVSLPDLYAAKQGHSPRAFEDPRLRLWTRDARRSGGAGQPSFPETAVAELRSAFERHALSLSRAMRADAELHQSLAQLRQLLPSRQQAISGLQLQLREL